MRWTVTEEQKAAIQALKNGKGKMNARNADLAALNKQMFPKSVPQYPKQSVGVLPNKTPNNSDSPISNNMKRIIHNHVGQFTSKVVPHSYTGGRKTRRVKRSRKTRSRR